MRGNGRYQKQPAQSTRIAGKEAHIDIIYLIEHAVLTHGASCFIDPLAFTSRMLEDVYLTDSTGFVDECGQICIK